MNLVFPRQIGKTDRVSRLLSLSARVEDAIAFGKIDLGRKSGSGGDYPMCGAGSIGKSPSVYYPSLWLDAQDQEVDLPDTGKAVIEYKVTRRTATTDGEGKKRYEVSLEIRSIEPQAKIKKPGATVKKFGVRARATYAFKSRNPMGEFESNDGQAIDSHTMVKAYGMPGRMAAVKGAAAGAGGVAAALLARKLKRRAPVV